MSNQTVYEESYKGYNIKIEYDDSPENPREAWDNLGKMQTWHKRYKSPKEAESGFFLGQKYYDLENPRDFMAWLKCADVIALPIYGYDHSCFILKTTPFHDPWDSGQYGWIFIEKSRIREEYGWKRITAKRRKQIEDYLKSEVETFSHYLNGQVYGWIVEDETGEHIDSCCGYYEDYRDYPLKEARSHIDYLVTNDLEKQWANVPA